MLNGNAPVNKILEEVIQTELMKTSLDKQNDKLFIPKIDKNIVLA